MQQRRHRHNALIWLDQRQWAFAPQCRHHFFVWRITAYCAFVIEARLDFERLDAIAARLPGVPLVLHGASSVPQEAVAAVNAHGGNVAGASGVPEDLLRRAAASAICKINIDTDLRLAVTAAIRTLLAERPETFDPRAYLSAGREAVREMVRHKIRAVLGSSGQA